MTAHRKASAPPPTSAAGAGHQLVRLAPLALDPATVGSAGYVRAAFDAVGAHPDVIASREAARTRGLPFMVQHAQAAGNLAKRSAEAHAQRADAPPL